MIKAGIFDVGGVLHSNRLFAPGDFTQAHFTLNEEDFLEIYAHREVLSLVRQLKNQNIHLAALSNTIEDHAVFLATMGIYDEFDELIFSYKVKLRKPDPRIFHIAIEKLRVKPDEVFFVDDLQENIDAANKLGIHGILFTSAEKLQNDLMEINVHI